MTPSPPPRPTPPEFPQSKTKTPKSLWKSLVSGKKIIKVKNDAVSGYAMYGFHLILLSGLELEHSKLPTKQPELQNTAYPFK